MDMKRRDFVKTSLASAAGFTALAGKAAEFTQPSGTTHSQYFELRTYTVKTPEQIALIEEHYLKAAVPALNRMGLKPIGVWTEVEVPTRTKVIVLIPYNSVEDFAATPMRLKEDTEYQSAGASYLSATKASPAYERIQSTLLIAFDGMKTVEVPEAPSVNKDRIFELRTYFSPSETKGHNKVRMFNSGEISLMKDVHLDPVFYGQAIAGENLPQLTYMTSGANAEEQKKHWKAFGDSPIWKAVLGDPQYADNVSGINKTFLKRSAASQI